MSHKTLKHKSFKILFQRQVQPLCVMLFLQKRFRIKKNVPWHILAPRRGCFGNYLLLRRVRFFVPLRSVHNKRHWRFAPLRSIFCLIGRNFLSYKKRPPDEYSDGRWFFYKVITFKTHFSFTILTKSHLQKSQNQPDNQPYGSDSK